MFRKLISVALLLVLVASACSKDSDDKADKSEKADKADEDKPAATATTAADAGTSELDEWIAAADEICAEADARSVELGDPPTEPDTLATWLGELQSIAEDQLAALQALDLPDERGEEAGEILAIIEELIGIIEEAGVQASAGDEAATQELFAEGEALSAEASEIAAGLGMEVCGDPAGGGSPGGEIESREDLVEFVMSQTGVTQDEAECAVGELLESYTEDELIELANSGAPAPPEAADALEACTGG